MKSSLYLIIRHIRSERYPCPSTYNKCKYYDDGKAFIYLEKKLERLSIVTNITPDKIANSHVTIIPNPMMYVPEKQP